MDIQPKQIEPIWEGKVTTVGTQCGFVLPRHMQKTFDMKKGKTYRLQVLEEIIPRPEINNAPSRIWTTKQPYQGVCA